MSQCHGNYINPMSLRQGVSMSWELYKSHVIEARCLNVYGNSGVSMSLGHLAHMTIYIIPMSHLRHLVSMSWELYNSHVIEARCLNVIGII